ncbi:hypothetical protein [Arthrobacter sp. UYP6]|uniref:hypothetical protein n=1 Tax=Arthrobacter sp. UYP6 TaxID=1756378 RepID=UPI0033973E3C
MSETANPPAESRQRRSHLSKLRTAAAGSVLAAVSITGVGVAAAPAQATELRSFLAPLEGTGQAALDTGGSDAEARDTAAGRLLGIREDLANAVAWGSVTQQQADGFYAQMQSRIARGL